MSKYALAFSDFLSYKWYVICFILESYLKFQPDAAVITASENNYLYGCCSTSANPHLQLLVYRQGREDDLEMISKLNLRGCRHPFF